MGDVGGKAADQRLDRVIEIARTADHDAERAVLRRLPRARDRRIKPRRTPGLQLASEIAGLADRGGAEIDDNLPVPDILENAVAFEHRAHVLRTGQAKEHDLALRDEVADCARDCSAIGKQPLQRLGGKVECDDARTALFHEVAADRLAHHAEPDEADALIPHALTFFSTRFLYANRNPLRLKTLRLFRERA